jgi:hypothetical protein
MEVSQEWGTNQVALASNSLYALDGWVGGSAGPQQLITSQHTYAPPGFLNCLQLYVTGAANPAPAADNYLIASQVIEGLSLARLQWGTVNALPLTIGFWIAINPGTYSVAVRNHDFTRCYVAAFTQTPADTAIGWTYRTITIPGCTDGTWRTNNQTAANISFCGMSGTQWQGAPGVWANTNKLAVTGQSNCVNAVGGGFYLTGVTMLPGVEGPTAAQSPLIVRPLREEIIRCKRYYQKRAANVVFNGYGPAAAWYSTYTYPVELRVPPTIGFLAPGYSNCSSYGIFFTGAEFLTVQLAIPGAGPGYAASGLVADARM